MANFQPPPIGDPLNSYRWVEWFRKLSGIFTAAGTVPWANVDKAGSNITDIVTRAHNNLQNIQGGTTGEYYHLTSAENTALANSLNGTFTPTFTSLTEVPGGGSITKTGRYTRIGRIVKFQVKISCSGGATTASTAGTTYVALPVTAAFDGQCTTSNTTTLLGIGVGAIDVTNSRAYPNTWGATSNTIVITGWYEV